VTVFVSPVIPGLNDRDIPRILEQAAAAGAQSASYTALRLPGSVESVFVSRLREVLPLRADRVLNRLRDIRGGNLSESRFGKRMRGSGTYWKSIDDLFQISKKRFGLDREGTGSACECRVGPREIRTEARPPGAHAADSAPSATPLVQLSFDFQP
jgi:DNA repair photolyase